MRRWLVWLLVSLGVAALVHAELAHLHRDHDSLLLVPLVMAVSGVVAAIGEGLRAAPARPRPRRPAAAGSGEDTRTTGYRKAVENHLVTKDDDDICWQLGALAARRLHRRHGLRLRDDPERVRELLGPVVTEWMSHDRRDRYDPAHRKHRRYSLAELSDAVRRIEQL